MCTPTYATVFSLIYVCDCASRRVLSFNWVNREDDEDNLECRYVALLLNWTAGPAIVAARD